MKTAYNKRVIAHIKQQAMKIAGAKKVSHIKPRAYCMLKSAPGCAVFVTPPCDSEPQVRALGESYNSSEVIHGSSVYECKVGKWYSLAYVTTPGCGMTYCICEATA